MTFIIQRAADRVAVPWRNGFGVQYEISADGPLPDGWSWRLSTADLQHNVPFSIFGGVNRQFCVATGEGVVLTIDGISYHCGPGSITPFDGGFPVHAAIINGPTCALNLMVKHGSPTKHLAVHVVGESIEGVEALVAIDDRASLKVDEIIVELDVLDALLNVGPGTICIQHGTVVAMY